MWISKQKLENLEKRIADVEEENQSQQMKNEELRMQAIVYTSYDIVEKECLNLKLLKCLFEKLNIDEPKPSDTI